MRKYLALLLAAALSLTLAVYGGPAQQPRAPPTVCRQVQEAMLSAVPADVAQQ